MGAGDRTALALQAFFAGLSYQITEQSAYMARIAIDYTGCRNNSLDKHLDCVALALNGSPQNRVRMGGVNAYEYHRPV